jgi:hypothetical protein
LSKQGRHRAGTAVEKPHKVARDWKYMLFYFAARIEGDKHGRLVHPREIAETVCGKYRQKHKIAISL